WPGSAAGPWSAQVPGRRAQSPRGREPSQQPERQGDLDADGEREVAANEDKTEPVVAHCTFVSGFAACMKEGGLGVPVLAGCLPAEAVDRSVASGGDDPPRGTRWQPAGGPPLHRPG